jgi:tetratricopeptide (TPR) repeat protein
MTRPDPQLEAAIATHRAGQLDAARRQYEEVLSQQPRRPEVLNLLGLVLRQVGQPAAAVDVLRRAIAIDPMQAVFFGNLAEAQRALGNSAEAIDCYRQAARLAPGIAEIHSNLGVLLLNAGRLDEAEICLQEALRVDPRYALAHYNLGNLYQKRKQSERAIDCYRRALELAPDNPDAQCNLGIALWERDELDEALEWLERSLRQRPDHVPALSNLAVVLQGLGRFEEARPSLERALALAPEKAELHLNYGTLLKDLGDPRAAVAWYDRVLAAQPKDPQALTSRGTALLSLGEFREGWAGYEHRIECGQYDVQSFPQPRWDGSRLEDQTLLVHCEQGYGDTFQFIRYIRMARQRAAKLIVGTQAPLLQLLTASGVPNLVPAGSALPPFDVHSPLMSLPRVLGTELSTVPADVPYLFADSALAKKWRGYFEAYPGYKVGIVWQGRKEYRGDQLRSIPLANFAPLSRVADVRLFSLQYGFGSEQFADLGRLPPEERFDVVDLAPMFDDAKGAFMDSAAIMQSLDLVISCDTAAAHLAGGLGVPVWVALRKSPEWRWMLDRDNSPWYPTMRLFRQTSHGDWSDVFGRMAEELRKQAGGRRLEAGGKKQ